MPRPPQTMGPVPTSTGLPSTWVLLPLIPCRAAAKAREVEQPAGVGRDQVRRAAEEVAVPDAQQCHQQRQVAPGAASQKWRSIAAAGQKSRKWAAPIAIASGRPIADQTE